MACTMSHQLQIITLHYIEIVPPSLLPLNRQVHLSLLLLTRYGIPVEGQDYRTVSTLVLRSNQEPESDFDST